LVQSNHATFHLASLTYQETMPNIVVIGLPTQASLRKTEAKLRAHGIAHYAWTEPDNDLGFTAIATAPLRGEQRDVLKNYRVYNAPGVLMASTSPSKGECGGSIPPGCANGAGTPASGVLA
jgi:hypothetical protein